MSAVALGAFALAALAAVATPGPTMILAMTNGSRHGVRGSAAGIAGAALSDVILISLVSIGIGSILGTSTLAFEVLRWIGVGYLCFLAVQLIIRARHRSETLGPTALPVDVKRQFATTLGVALTNPKGYLFFAALLPQFVSTSEPALPQYLALAATFVSIDIIVMVCYAGIGVISRKAAPSRGIRAVNYLSGGALLLVAIGLALMKT